MIPTNGLQEGGIDGVSEKIEVDYYRATPIPPPAPELLQPLLRFSGADVRRGRRRARVIWENR